MRKYLTGITLAVVLFTSVSCNKFEANPYEVNVPPYMRNLNQRNIQQLWLQEGNADDTVTILFSGDSQRFYDELEDLVAKTNSFHHIDFFILAGDISDFGLNREYTWIYERISRLNIPYICAIGNHDLTARAGEIYSQMFGEKNFSFRYKGYKFLFHDTNGREYGFNGSTPNLNWINEQMADPNPSWFVGVSHVPPFDDDFDPSLKDKYKNLLASSPRFILSLHGHKHGTLDAFHYGDHVRYILCNSVERREAMVLKLHEGNIYKSFVAY